MSIAVTTRKFTVDEYHTMIRSGILQEDDRVELLAGEIVEMSPISSKHAGCLKRLVEFFSVLLVRKEVHLGVQDPIFISDTSEPQPDLCLLKYRRIAYSDHHPRPHEIYLLIEISDSSRTIDREIKLPIYAKAGIREVWLVDLVNEIIERYLEPKGNAYQRIEKYIAGQEISPQAFPDFRLAVKDILLK